MRDGKRIRKAKESDIEGILEVLNTYHFKVITAIDNAPIDSDAADIITVYNQVSQIDLKYSFVALLNGKIVGFCNYKPLDDGVAKTTLLAVLPQYRGLGLGKALQLTRMKEAYKSGYKKLITFCESPEIVNWYQKHFNYKIIKTEPVHHRLHFLQSKNGIVWGIHYGLKAEFLKVMICDLEEYYT